MTLGQAIVTFVIPAVALATAYVAMRLNERASHRTPGE